MKAENKERRGCDLFIYIFCSIFHRGPLHTHTGTLKHTLHYKYDTTSSDPILCDQNSFHESANQQKWNKMPLSVMMELGLLDDRESFLV